jgi:hypothetical protein
VTSAHSSPGRSERKVPGAPSVSASTATAPKDNPHQREESERDSPDVALAIGVAVGVRLIEARVADGRDDPDDECRLYRRHVPRERPHLLDDDERSREQDPADDLLGGVGELEPPPLVPTADHPPDAPNPHSKSVTIRPGSLRRGSPHSTAVRNSRQYGTFVIPTEPRSNDPIPSHTSRSPQYTRICIRVHRRAEPVLFLLADSPP